jgi:hypothetical protein
MTDTKEMLRRNVEAVVREIKSIGKEPEWTDVFNCSNCKYCTEFDDGHKCAYYGYDEYEEKWEDDAEFLDDLDEPYCDLDDWEASNPKSDDYHELKEQWDNYESIEFDGDMRFPDVGSWLEDQLCLERLIYFGNDRSFAGAEISCCLGGPNVRVDTDDERVYGAWGVDRYDLGVDCDEINEYLEEIYDRAEDHRRY